MAYRFWHCLWDILYTTSLKKNLGQCDLRSGHQVKTSTKSGPNLSFLQKYITRIKFVMKLSGYTYTKLTKFHNICSAIFYIFYVRSNMSHDLVMLTQGENFDIVPVLIILQISASLRARPKAERVHRQLTEIFHIERPGPTRPDPARP